VTKTDLNVQLNVQLSNVLDRGIGYGEACFETFRVIEGEVFALDQHFSRLADGLQSFGILLSKGNMESIRAQAIEHAAGIADDVLVKVTVTGGIAEWGLIRNRDQQPEVYIQCMPYVPTFQKIMLSTVEWPYATELKQAKFSSDYALSLRATKQWEGEGLSEKMTPLICKNGLVLSGLTTNVLLYREGSWHTPDESNGGVLQGVVRNELVAASVLTLSDCPVLWLDDCEAIGFTNSGVFIQPASMVNSRKLNREHQAFEMLYQVLRDKPGMPKL